MGKCGGHELNYVSDVDVIFVVEPAEGHDEHAAVRVGTMLASNMMRICSDHTGEGTIWPVDAALRPEGKSGPLVRTLASHLGYYERWAKTWEFQALLKARPVAGDLELGRPTSTRSPRWCGRPPSATASSTDVQAMRRRVLEHIPVGHAERQIKLGAGRAARRRVRRAAPAARARPRRRDDRTSTATLSALAHLTERGYVGREDGAALDAAYRFLRTLEHRMQLSRAAPHPRAARRRAVAASARPARWG